MAQQIDGNMQSCLDCGHLPHLDNPGEHKFEYIKSDEELLQEGLMCPLTLEPLFDAVDLPCGHTFSRYAIAAHFQIKKKGCPVCKANCNKISSVSIIIRNILDKLQIRCPKQCGAIIERSTIKDHLKICPSILVFCSNKLKGELCMHVAIRKNMNIHEMTECNLRIIPCPGNCGIIARDFGTHNCVIHLKNQLDVVKKDLDEIKKNQEKVQKEQREILLINGREMLLMEKRLNDKLLAESNHYRGHLGNIYKRLQLLEKPNLLQPAMAPVQPAMAPAMAPVQPAMAPFQPVMAPAQPAMAPAPAQPAMAPAQPAMAPVQPAMAPAPVQPAMAPAPVQPAMAPDRIIIAPTKFETLQSNLSIFEIILKNAEKGDSYSQYNLGRRYENGHGVIKSKDDAIKWYTKAANAGVLLAKDDLDRLLSDNDVIEISKHDENSRKRKAENDIYN